MANDLEASFEVLDDQLLLVKESLLVFILSIQYGMHFLHQGVKMNEGLLRKMKRLDVLVKHLPSQPEVLRYLSSTHSRGKKSLIRGSLTSVWRGILVLVSSAVHDMMLLSKRRPILIPLS